ncbi:MAG: allophanate hydrolase [Verrucomicrobiales bacterium]|nr:allophanate hydrolase [Verrucomicrobiales bacterium]
MTPLKLLRISDLQRSYCDGTTSPRDVILDILQACDESDPKIWIERLSSEAVLRYVDQLENREPSELPLFGIPFAIKDNIDLAGVPTTAGCPEYAYTPEVSAPAVARLIEAGAIPIGKTNLDQFATGLVGVRSPYGYPANPYQAEIIPGGSSSGSAVAVTSGLVSFALGTDTAGSGRVPASLNNLVGLKPTMGLVSCRGVVPACRSLDCVTVFAGTVEESARVVDLMAGFDEEDPYSRAMITPLEPSPSMASAKIGVPRPDQLKFFGNDEAAGLFGDSLTRCRELGWEVAEIDFEPFLEAARLLYEGPWVAERLAAIEPFFEKHGEDMFPVTAKIIGGAKGLSAVSAFKAEYRLRALKRRADEVWSTVDAILTPTLGSPYSTAEVEADPIQLNSNLGYYTNFMNLLDYAAVAVPSGFLTQQGMPWGVTLFGPAFRDPFLLGLASRFHDATGLLSPSDKENTFDPGAMALGSTETCIDVVVCGAHLSGLPLNHQLTTRGARFVEATETAPVYRMFSLPATDEFPARPGLVRDEEKGGAIEVEIWSVPASTFGSFVEGIGSPLGIGKLLLTGQREVSGFLCESHAIVNAEEITGLGGWRKYVGG